MTAVPMDHLFCEHLQANITAACPVRRMLQMAVARVPHLLVGKDQ